MRWEQIERKWVLMTHRIRADFGPGETEAAGRDIDLIGPGLSVTTRVSDGGADRVGRNEAEASSK